MAGIMCSSVVVRSSAISVTFPFAKLLHAMPKKKNPEDSRLKISLNHDSPGFRCAGVRWELSLERDCY